MSSQRVSHPEDEPMHLEVADEELLGLTNQRLSAQSGP
jgi:hypothetical protein